MTGKLDYVSDGSACWRFVWEKEGLLQVSLITVAVPIYFIDYK